MTAFVYILASARNGTLYIGVTNDLTRRVYEHKNDFIVGFTSRYQIHLLVHYEIFGDMYEAIRREQRLKKWKRVWKIRLIEESNPQWRDLYSEIA